MHAYPNQDKHLLAVDSIIFGFEAEELKVLLTRRRLDPAKGEWSLMGGFVHADESLDDAAARVVKELTGLEGVFMEQLHTYGAVDRDPGARIVSVAYYTLIRVDLYDPELGRKHGAAWVPVHDLPPLVFDHPQMLRQALEVLQRKTRIQPIGFELLPEKFTLPQLMALYNAINFDKPPLDPGNFSKKIHRMDLLTRLPEKDKSGSRKGAFYYRFNKERYQKLLEEGLAFSL
ncbi:MAG: NUDIX domain-containing protein [Bacteroidia bacterium]